MHFVKILAVLALLPVFWGALSNKLLRREYAIALLGFSFFLGGDYAVDAALISWPLWPAPTRGIIVSATDCLAWALLLTSRHPLRNLPLKSVFFSYATVIAISIPLSTMPIASTFVLWQATVIFLLYAAIAGEVVDPKQLQYLLCGVAGGLILEAVVVASQKAEGVVRANGTMSHSNVLAVMVELALPPILAILLDGSRQRVLWLGVVAALFVLTGGGSRAGIALGGISVLLTLLLSAYHSMTSRKLAVLGSALFTLGVAVPVAFATLSNRFGGASVFAEEDQRAALERTARNMAGDHPFGVGANVFVTVANVGGYSEKAGVAWSAGNRSAPVHNTYLLMRAEMGWQGLIVWTALLIVPLFVGLRTSFRAKHISGSGVLLGSVTSLFMLSIHSFYEWAPITYGCLALLAFDIAIIGGFKKRLVMASLRRVRRQPSNNKKSDVSSSVLLS